MDGGRLAELRRSGAEWPPAAAALVEAVVAVVAEVVAVFVAVSAMARKQRVCGVDGANALMAPAIRGLPTEPG